MKDYFDQQVPECEDCHYFAKGAFPDGKPYECCRFYGYIFHCHVLGTCEAFKSETQWKHEEMMRIIMEKSKDKK